MGTDYKGEIPIGVEARVLVRTDTHHAEIDTRTAELAVFLDVNTAGIKEVQDYTFGGSIKEVGEQLDKLPALGVDEVIDKYVNTTRVGDRVEAEKDKVTDLINTSRRQYLAAGSLGGTLFAAGTTMTVESFAHNYNIAQKIGSPLALAVGAAIVYLGRKTTSEGSVLYEPVVVDELNAIVAHSEKQGVLKAILKSVKSVKEDQPERTV
jgi:hypothetical protein